MFDRFVANLGETIERLAQDIQQVLEDKDEDEPATRLPDPLSYLEVPCWADSLNAVEPSSAEGSGVVHPKSQEDEDFASGRHGSEGPILTPSWSLEGWANWRPPDAWFEQLSNIVHKLRPPEFLMDESPGSRRGGEGEVVWCGEQVVGRPDPLAPRAAGDGPAPPTEATTVAPSESTSASTPHPPQYDHAVPQNSDVPNIPLLEECCGRKNPFEYRDSVNKKLRIFAGDICRLQVDGMVVFTGDCNEFPEKLLRTGGRELQETLQQQQRFHSGDCRAVAVRRFHCSHFLWCAGPRRNPKYKTASENCLNSCYRESFKRLVEEKLRTIAIPCLYLNRRIDRDEVFGHISLRTIRRWMEKVEDKIDAVVLVTSTPTEASEARRLLPLYFPRSHEEQIRSAAFLPDDVGNSDGETRIEERRIRIGMMRKDSAEDENSQKCEASQAAQDEDCVPSHSVPTHDSEIAEVTGSDDVKLEEDDEISGWYIVDAAPCRYEDEGVECLVVPPRISQ